MTAAITASMCSEQLERAARPRLRVAGDRSGAATVYNPVRGLVQSKDSLSILTNDQLRALTALDAWVTQTQDSIVAPLARYLADLPNSYDRTDVGRRLFEVQQRLFATVIDGMTQAREIFTAEQINEFPPFLRASFDIRRLRSSRQTRQ